MDSRSPYDSFALGEYGLSSEDIASIEAATASNEYGLSPEEQAGVPSSSSMAALGSTASGAKRSRSSTSGVWEHFDRTTKQDAAGNEVPYAICKICRHELSARSTGGTGHLLRHATRCRTKQGLAMRQTQLQYNPDGTVSSWDYDPQVARQSLCRLIASEDLPLGFGESSSFQNYIKTAHNPRFTSVSRQTTTRDLVKYYNERRNKIKELFSTCTFSVALTSDIWSGRARDDYLSVAAHYVNDMSLT